LKAFPVVVEQPVTIVTVQEIEKAVERSTSHFSRILQFNGTGGKIAGIGVGHFTVFDALVVEPLECGTVHENFTSYFKEVGVPVDTQSVGDFLDRTYVSGYVITL